MLEGEEMMASNATGLLALGSGLLPLLTAIVFVNTLSAAAENPAVMSS